MRKHWYKCAHRTLRTTCSSSTVERNTALKFPPPMYVSGADSLSHLRSRVLARRPYWASPNTQFMSRLSKSLHRNTSHEHLIFRRDLGNYKFWISDNALYCIENESRAYSPTPSRKSKGVFCIQTDSRTKSFGCFWKKYLYFCAWNFSFMKLANWCDFSSTWEVSGASAPSFQPHVLYVLTCGSCSRSHCNSPYECAEVTCWKLIC